MTKILVVDDEREIVKLTTLYLEAEGYEVISAFDGEQGQQVIEKKSDEISAIILDWAMPKMNGIELLSWMKGTEQYERIPVIMQTAMIGASHIKQGIDAGAFYYLTKPIQRDLMISIVKAAVSDYQFKNQLLEKIKKEDNPYGLLQEGVFRFRSLDEAEYLAVKVANASASPQYGLGISEILINAVEHGNLGITYREKTDLVTQGAWRNEVDRRLALPEHLNKSVKVTFKKLPDKLSILVEDQGPGFEWEKYLDMDEIRVFDNHGRGIAITKSYLQLKFFDPGNKVLIGVPFK